MKGDKGGEGQAYKEHSNGIGATMSFTFWRGANTCPCLQALVFATYCRSQQPEQGSAQSRPSQHGQMRGQFAPGQNISWAVFVT